MKKNTEKKLLWICVIILIIVIYKFVNSYYQIETFLNPFKKKKKKKNKSLEETYNITDKKIDEPSLINIWEIKWIKEQINNTSLQKLWKKLELKFPKN